MGKLVLIIGGANQGKSYYTKQQLNENPKTPCFVYDVQGAYGNTSTKENDIIMSLPLNPKGDESRCRWYGEPTDFLNIATRRRKTNIVIEEATIFFEGKTQKEMRRLMVDRFHHKNNIFIMFHSINAANPRILEMSDYIVLFKTGDDANTIKRKYGKLLEPFLKLKQMPDRSKIIIKNI
jgi:hypothetical protein